MRHVLALSLLIASSSFAADIEPFTSDGCSSFPDGKPENPALWLDCCIRHDIAYWKGGTEQERLDADLALEQCVAKAGEPEPGSVGSKGRVMVFDKLSLPHGDRGRRAGAAGSSL